MKRNLIDDDPGVWFYGVIIKTLIISITVILFIIGFLTIYGNFCL